MFKYFEKYHEGIIAFLALIISLVAIWQATQSLQIQRVHNAKSLIPIAQLNRKDYQDIISVELINKGLGPLKIMGLKVFVAGKPSEYHTNIVDFMPALKGEKLMGKWNTWKKGIIGSVLSPSESYILIKYKRKNTPTFKENRKAIREVLKDLRMEIVYEDVYNNQFNESWTFKTYGD